LINGENGVVISLGVGSYYYEVNSTDTQNYTGAFDSQTYVVTQATPTPTLTITPSNSEIYGTETTASCSYSESEVIAQLFRDDVSVSSPDVQTLAVGSYVYVCNNTATQNYTVNEVSDTLTINPAPSTVNLYLNDSRADFQLGH